MTWHLASLRLSNNQRMKIASYKKMTMLVSSMKSSLDHRKRRFDENKCLMKW
jgi:hypothetical protein